MTEEGNNLHQGLENSAGDIVSTDKINSVESDHISDDSSTALVNLCCYSPFWFYVLKWGPRDLFFVFCNSMSQFI